jgi:hypothetical protein
VGRQRLCTVRSCFLSRRDQEDFFAAILQFSRPHQLRDHDGTLGRRTARQAAIAEVPTDMPSPARRHPRKRISCRCAGPHRWIGRWHAARPPACPLRIGRRSCTLDACRQQLDALNPSRLDLPRTRTGRDGGAGHTCRGHPFCLRTQAEGKQPPHAWSRHAMASWSVWRNTRDIAIIAIFPYWRLIVEREQPRQQTLH